MFLKRLDIIGFKSFADKTGIEFSPGLTAVVGPNGSGKSNIADAVRWVLGEQSARTLRGSKMEDVIFAGSETRRSIHFCEVSLTLDNADRHLPVVFDEVTVTRRVYRTGESEYLINRQPCRLRDIAELFMDSGVGRESYSIIGQGKIEEMLSTRAEDRRGPFEDAAGIVKFKFRKRDAERKLEETAANIVRVDDIFSELERQAGPLEREAEKATRFQELQSELTTLDISLLVQEIEGLKETWQQTQAGVTEWKERRDAELTQLAVIEQSEQQVRTELETRMQALESAQQGLTELIQTRQREDGELALLRQRLDSGLQTKADREQQLQQVQAERQELQQQQTNERDRLQEVLGLLEQRSGDLEVAAERVDPGAKAKLEAEIEARNGDLIEVHHQAAGLRNELKRAAESIEDEERKRDRLNQERARHEEELAEQRRIIAKIQDELDELANSRKALETRLATANKSLGEATATEAACAQRLSQLQSQLAALTSRAELLKDLEEGYDGYAGGVRTVLQAADRGKIDGIHGAVANLIHVDKRYEVAIETALGGALQNVLTTTEAAAREAIDMLKRRQGGRATFMPLSVIRSRRLAEAELSKVKSQRGWIGLAADLVRTDETYHLAVDHLLGNVIVAEQLRDANELARLLNYRVRIVTLDGDVVSPGGLMSGGSHQRRGPGLLGRTRERAQIEQQLADLKQQQTELTRQQAEAREAVLAAQAEQRACGVAMNELQTEVSAEQAALREAQAREQHAVERYEAVIWEAEQTDVGKSSWMERQTEAQKQLTEADDRIASLEQTLAQLRQQIELRNQDVASAQEALTALRVEVATLAQERDTVVRRADEFAERIARLNQRDDELKEEINRLAAQMSETEQSIGTSGRRLQQLTVSVSEMEENLGAMRLQRTQMEGSVRQAAERVRQQQQAVHTAEEQLHRIEVSAERMDADLTYALNRLGETYHMTFEWAKSHFPPVEDATAAKSKADSLRSQVRALGEVRVGAIDEWQRLSERMNFLSTERADLDAARNQLLDLIREMDEEMSRLFAATFEQIRAEFQVAFRQLFNGGRADLTLTDEDDLLTTGIDIMAQPPGKKLQNLNLMSGGERALTAMALLFAILRVRPVPFCVLDEVEAALDEANVGRFAQYLRKFSSETQFIVITHRRGTMEEADALYGVTMQESGVSSLVSVRLSDDEASEHVS